MAARANLEGKLTADTAPFIRAFAAAQAKATQFTKATEGAFQQLDKDFTNLAGKLAGPLLGLVSIQGLAQITNELDEVGDSADNLEVSARFLGALGEAARLTGTDAATANTAMSRLLQTIGDARRGETAALDIFRNLGIDVNELGSNEEAVYSIARALGEYETNAERASVAADLFGRQGRKLAELFAEGETGLRDQIAQVERAGLVYSNAAVSTGQATKDAGQNIGRFFKVGIAELGAGLAQGGVFLKNFVDEATNFNVSISEAAQRANAAVVDMIDAQERAARASESLEPRRQAIQGGGGVGFAAPFLFEAFRRVWPGIVEQGSLKQFRELSQTFQGIPLSGAGRGSLEVWEAMRRLENMAFEQEGRRAEREGRPSRNRSGFILDQETQSMIQQQRMATALEKIEQNTAVLKQ